MFFRPGTVVFFGSSLIFIFGLSFTSTSWRQGRKRTHDGDGELVGTTVCACLGSSLPCKRSPATAGWCRWRGEFQHRPRWSHSPETTNGVRKAKGRSSKELLNLGGLSPSRWAPSCSPRRCCWFRQWSVNQRPRRKIWGSHTNGLNEAEKRNTCAS